MKLQDTPIVLTERLGAIGWQLAGARVRVVGPAVAVEAFAAACQSATLVLLSAAVARGLPPTVLAAARRSAPPFVLVIDESLDSAAARPVARHARAVLGVEA